MKNISLLSSLNLMLMFSCCSETFASERVDYLYQNYVKDTLIFQAGFFGPYQGENQHININNIIGDNFSVKNSNNLNAVFGLGYYRDAHQFEKFKLQYGIDVMYLLPSKINGLVNQENFYDNFSYSYKVTNIPFYAALKGISECFNKGYQLYVDGGIGPNIMVTSGFNQKPLNNYTVPEQLFKGSTNATFTAMAGVGIRANEWFGRPVECGYRFMYLGKSQLNINNSEVVDALSTGQNYTHSLVCGLTF